MRRIGDADVHQRLFFIILYVSHPLIFSGSHHNNISVIYLVQNLFHKSKEQRTISLNAHYIILFKNPRDMNQITHLAKQMYPGKNKFLQESFRDATSKPFGYLVIDLKQTTPEELRVRTDVFREDTTLVYLQK